jgi:4-hydroxy-tetrahydrodipicolinate reductase
MKVAILGYGKMGQIIEKIALERGHNILLKINQHNIDELNIENLKKADVVIDFSTPESAKTNIILSIDANKPIISGTTGWLDDYKEVKDYCIKNDGAFLFASNFSLGVNLFFELNKNLAKLMKKHQQYQINLTEIHHSEKLDAPSGTAISLAEQIISESDIKNKWTINSENSDEELKIDAQRKGNITGTHSVNYKSKTDSISIIHEAHSRNGFALGAIIAAEWIMSKKGVFSMHDVLFSS